ncbi:META domain-containing protein [Pontiella agarivorans]|uniref:META domain-containing protein n=1 Tax=Pontiella agarivorans TaxID=3038953 RepID=A0ABU5MZE3_9BACT|nr:META domain-containing protein [Pontiella agarivorans]MDZ8119476.1 META domain-containing protein [Pontiella agarivorans]
MKRWAVWSVLCILLCVSCKTSMKEIPEIEGIAWELSGILASDGQCVPPVHNSLVWFKLSEGQITGNAGANRFFGEYVLKGQKIHFSLMGSGMMMGTPELMAQENQLLKRLGEAVDYQVVGEELQLRNENQRVVVQMKPRLEPALFSGVWKMTGVNNGKGGVTSLLAGTEISLEFTPDGAVSGSTGCNVLTGSCTLKGETIRFNPLATTRRFYSQPEGVMEQESAFLQALENSRVWKIEADVLELRDESGALQVKGVLK